MLPPCGLPCPAAFVVLSVPIIMSIIYLWSRNFPDQQVRVEGTGLDGGLGARYGFSLTTTLRP